jgi:hypothetical protein
MSGLSDISITYGLGGGIVFKRDPSDNPDENPVSNLQTRGDSGSAASTDNAVDFEEFLMF